MWKGRGRTNPSDPCPPPGACKTRRRNSAEKRQHTGGHSGNGCFGDLRDQPRRSQSTVCTLRRGQLELSLGSVKETNYSPSSSEEEKGVHSSGRHVKQRQTTYRQRPVADSRQAPSVLLPWPEPKGKIEEEDLAQHKETLSNKIYFSTTELFFFLQSSELPPLLRASSCHADPPQHLHIAPRQVPAIPQRRSHRPRHRTHRAWDAPLRILCCPHSAQGDLPHLVPAPLPLLHTLQTGRPPRAGSSWDTYLHVCSAHAGAWTEHAFDDK